MFTAVFRNPLKGSKVHSKMPKKCTTTLVCLWSHKHLTFSCKHEEQLVAFGIYKLVSHAVLMLNIFYGFIMGCRLLLHNVWGLEVCPAGLSCSMLVKLCGSLEPKTYLGVWTPEVCWWPFSTSFSMLMTLIIWFSVNFTILMLSPPKTHRFLPKDPIKKLSCYYRVYRVWAWTTLMTSWCCFLFGWFCASSLPQSYNFDDFALTKLSIFP